MLYRLTALTLVGLLFAASTEAAPKKKPKRPEPTGVIKLDDGTVCTHLGSVFFRCCKGKGKHKKCHTGPIA